MSSIFRDRPHFFKESVPFLRERLFKLQKWPFRAFKTPNLRGSDLEGSKLKGMHVTDRNQGNALHQDFALFIECKNRVLIINYCRDKIIADPENISRNFIAQNLKFTDFIVG